MKIGVAYYPEHWPEDRWPTDARLIKESGVDLVRVGEFAWSRLEPRRGQYELEWLDRAIEVLAGQGLQVILCTPSAAPPAWLFHRHPSMIPQDREGKNWFRGSRRHVCLNNRPYRRYVRHIVRELARYFGHNPHLYAWQIDNELGCHGSGRCFCDDCEQAFREWLKKRYGTIERLNKLWGTAFWSQEFADWHLVPAPRRTPAGVHPSLALDYQRFISATVRDFVKEQRDIIRQYGGEQRPITTNCLALGTDQIDQFSLGTQQEVASVDNYPVSEDNVDGPALALDLTRSVKRGAFWVLEQQAGPTLIRRGPRAHPPDGALRLWSYQAAARGAELISYFRWRTCPFGQEMHWYGMLDPDGALPRRYDELRRTIAELKRNSHLWQGMLPDARVALVLDYSSHWGLRADSMAARIDYLGQFRAFYGLLRKAGLAVDIVPPQQDPFGYAALVVPMPLIVREDNARQWEAFVRKGGVLLATAPAGCRTEQNAWLMAKPPGPLAGLLGVRVSEHEVYHGATANRVSIEGRSLAAGPFCAMLEPVEAETLGSYEVEPYAGRAAVTRRPAGEGAAYFLGSIGEPDLYELLLRAVLRDAGLEPNPWSSERVEVVPLRDSDGKAAATFVLNHSGQTVELALPDGAACRDLLSGTDHCEAVRLGPFGVALIQRA